MKSKGILQIVIGLLVSGTSFIINYRTKSSKFLLFLFVGLVFLAYGALKFLFYMLTRPKKEKLEKKEVEPVKKHQEAHKKVVHPSEIKQFNHNNSPFHTHHETIVACHSCNTKHYSNANFCQMCGSRLK